VSGTAVCDEGAAFEHFVRAHTTELLRTAFLLTGSRYSAEELVQDTLAHLYPQWHRVSAAEAPVAYVRRSLANRFVSRHRSPANRDLAMWELPDGWDGKDLSETVTTRRMIWQLLGELPNRQRTAVVLRYFNDLTDAQIADVLGCRPGSVRSLISRAVGAMRGEGGQGGKDSAAAANRMEGLR
jgi:RNA polymerase sigma-70 factor (sigma-E family)